MEFVNQDNNIFNKLIINKKCTTLTINNINYNIIKVGFFEEEQGKFETEEYIVKFSKKTLYIYDREHNLISVYKFSKFINDVLNVFNVFNTEVQLINSFILKKDYRIVLYRENNNTYYITNNNNKEEIKEIKEVGKDIIYISIYNNELCISKNRNSKWNGCPIGKDNMY